MTLNPRSIPGVEDIPIISPKLVSTEFHQTICRMVEDACRDTEEGFVERTVEILERHVTDDSYVICNQWKLSFYNMDEDIDFVERTTDILGRNESYHSYAICNYWEIFYSLNEEAEKIATERGWNEADTSYIKVNVTSTILGSAFICGFIELYDVLLKDKNFDKLKKIFHHCAFFIMQFESLSMMFGDVPTQTREGFHVHWPEFFFCQRAFVNIKNQFPIAKKLNVLII